MEYEETTGARLSVLEARMAALEQRQAVLETAGTLKPKRQRRELTPEEKQAVRARLLAGQEKARARREAEARSQAKAGKNGKEAEHEG